MRELSGMIGRKPEKAKKKESFTYTLAERLASPDVRTRRLKEQERLEAIYQDRERVLEDRELIDILREYGVDPTGLEREEDGTFRLPVRSHFSDRHLPNKVGETPEYFYRGGAARALLLRSLRIDPTYEPRDVDLVAIGTMERVPGQDVQLASEFMPEDWEHGHGVERLKDEETARQEYFETRDFTLNEILATDDAIWVTRQGLLDTVRRIIRVTPYEHRLFEGVGPKLLSKALRFCADGINRWGDISVDEEIEQGLDQTFIAPFWMAVQLDRACEQSLFVAQTYVNELVRLRRLPEEIETINDATQYLLQHVYEFAFRHAPTEQFDLEDEWVVESKKDLGRQIGIGRSTAKRKK